MWKPLDTAPRDERVLVSVRGKVVIGRLARRWDGMTNAPTDERWSFYGHTLTETREWVPDGWQPLPVAINAKPKPQRKKLTYADCLMLSLRTSNVLEREGLTSKEAIEGLTLERLLSLKGLGQKGAREVLEWRDKPDPAILKNLSLNL